jgi:PLP dependent protein
MVANGHCTVTDMDVLTILRRNVARVEAELANACARAGRPRQIVTLVAITKYVDVTTTAMLASCGIGVLGESRPQTLWDKAPRLPAIEWHLVGHLQRNKVERTLPVARLIHSVDSERLLKAIDEEAQRQGKTQDVLLEILLSHEASKHGFAPAEWARLADLVNPLKHVRVCGLMCMAALDATPDQARQTFAALRALRDEGQQRFAQPHRLTHLSMGMSHDFPEAIVEGATLVRIGSAFFEGIQVAN